MGKDIKLPLATGFAALCNHIKAIKQTAEQLVSAVSALAEATAASMEEIEGILGEKQDASNAVPFTIPATGWGSDSTAAYPKYYDLAVDGITVKDRADVLISPAGIAAAASCGLCPTTETLAGKIRIRAASIPSESIAAQYWIETGKG